MQPLHRNVGGRRPRTTQIVAPRFGRALTWTLRAAGINDFLQAGFAALAHTSSELESRAES